MFFLIINFGAWPSGKAAGFDPVYRRFESYRPSHFSSYDNSFVINGFLKFLYKQMLMFHFIGWVLNSIKLK